MSELQRVVVQTEPTGSEAPKPAAQDAVMTFETRPDWLPEKFYNAETKTAKVSDLAKSYAELEKAKPAETKPNEPPKGEPQAPAISIPGVPAESVTKYTKEVKDGGKLSEASYSELAKAGFPKEVVDVYLKGIGVDAAVEQGVKSAQDWAKVYDSIGGKDVYGELTAWAGQNLSDAEIDAFNEAVQGKSVQAAELAIRGLHAKYKQANGEGLNLIDGEIGDGAGHKAYTSIWEMQQDMRSPRYAQDEGFRKQVEQRLKRSSIL